MEVKIPSKTPHLDFQQQNLIFDLSDANEPPSALIPRLRFGSPRTFESPGGSFPADRALMKQSPPAHGEVLPAKHPPPFDFPQRLWLHLVLNVSKSSVFFVEVNH